MTPVLMTLSLFAATAAAQLVYGSTLYFACTAMDARHVTFRHALTNAMGVLILSLFVVLTTVASSISVEHAICENEIAKTRAMHLKRATLANMVLLTQCRHLVSWRP